MDTLDVCVCVCVCHRSAEAAAQCVGTPREAASLVHHVPHVETLTHGVIVKTVRCSACARGGCLVRMCWPRGATRSSWTACSPPFAAASGTSAHTRARAHTHRTHIRTRHAHIVRVLCCHCVRGLKCMPVLRRRRGGTQQRTPLWDGSTALCDERSANHVSMSDLLTATAAEYNPPRTKLR